MRLLNFNQGQVFVTIWNKKQNLKFIKTKKVAKMFRMFIKVYMAYYGTISYHKVFVQNNVQLQQTTITYTQQGVVNNFWSHDNGNDCF